MPITRLSELVGKGRSRRAAVDLVAAEPGSLTLAVTEREDARHILTRTLRLNGRWRLGPANTLEFELDKSASRKNIFSFGTRWRVNSANEIELTHAGRSVSLQGVWDLSNRNVLVYRIGKSPEETLRFKGAFQTHSIFAKKGEIRYQLGAEAVQKKRTRTVTLFGRWLLSRELGLSFEIEYADGRRRAIRFGGDCRLDKGRTVRVDLALRKGKPLGAELVLTQDLKDGEAFLRLVKTLQESRAETGVRLNW